VAERPILFSVPMVRAILDGRKTQTRRVVKLQPRSRADIGHHGSGMPFIRNPDPLRANVACPYGQPGDRLWVRETWAIRMYSSMPLQVGGGDWHVFYEADGHHELRPEAGAVKIERGALGRLRPSIHMPRWACRLVLEVTEVSVERLQDISWRDCMAEGTAFFTHPAGDDIGAFESWQAAYRALWDAINGAGAWDANPWVWVVDFKRVTP
jgi:hypothetical protein